MSRPTIHTWLAQVRERPGMHLPGGRLDLLEAQVDGYYACLHLRGLVEDGPSMRVAHFGFWLLATRRWSAAAGWAAAIERHARGRPSPEVFFELWDEFRDLAPTTVSSVTLAPRHGPTGKRVVIGSAGKMARPDRVEVRQYRPLDLFHFRWHRGDRVDDDWMLLDPTGDPFTSLPFAKQWAADELGIELEVWRDRSP